MYNQHPGMIFMNWENINSNKYYLLNYFFHSFILSYRNWKYYTKRTYFIRFQHILMKQIVEQFFVFPDN